MATELEGLYAQVTEAIFRRQRFCGGEEGRIEADREVSALEEQIASLLPASDFEGEIARKGAVLSALDARDEARALELAERYLAEDGLSADFAVELDVLRHLAKDLMEKFPSG